MTFVNIGNTCYVSSILQCLLSTQPLQKYILKCNDSFGNLHEMKTITKQYVDDEKINIYSFLKTINPEFLKKEQHDVIDILLDILENLRKNVAGLKNTFYKGPSKISWCIDNKHNIIDEIFKFQKQVDLRCKQCGYKICTYESDYIIYNKFQENVETLDDYTCDSCGDVGCVERFVKYTHYPKVFILCDPVKFFLKWKCYQTYALCIHRKINDDLGHYTSLVCKNDVWYYCDDTKKYAFDMRDIQKHNVPIRLMFLIRSV